MAFGSFFSKPAAVAFGIVIVLAGRWIWVAGLGDYGWSYEIAARIAQGEIFYRDFPSLYGPLSHYTLAGLMLLFGKHLIVYHVHLWLSYVLSLFAGLLIVSELGAAGPAQIAGVSLAAVIACPIFTFGHAFNYQAPFLAGIAVFSVLRAERSHPHLWAGMAGLASALCVYCKQNVGAVILILIPFFLLRAGRTIYMAAAGCTALGIFAYFSAHAGAGEVFRELFTDGASAKGGLLTAVLRAVPRLMVDPQLRARRLWEAGITAAIYAGMLPAARRMLDRGAGEKQKYSMGLHGAVLLAGACLSAALSASAVRLRGYEHWIIQPWPLFLQLAYILLACVSAVYLFRRASGRWRTAVLLVLAVTAVQEASNPNFAYSASLAIPLLCAMIFPREIWLRPGALFLGIAGIYWIGLTAVGPIAYYGPFGFQPTEPLPSGSPFCGLRAPKLYAARVEELWDHARPIIRGRRTLWLAGGGGPYLAFGGLPVYNAPCYMADSFPLRLEEKLVQSWQRRPPEAIVLSEGFAPPGSRYLTQSYLSAHILPGYAEIWRGDVAPRIAVWVRQAQNTGQQDLGARQQKP
jgi:hypothetical protein